MAVVRPERRPHRKAEHVYLTYVGEELRVRVRVPAVLVEERTDGGHCGRGERAVSEERRSRREQRVSALVAATCPGI